MKSAFSVVVTGQSLITQDIRCVSDDRFTDIVRFLKQGDVAFTNFESTILGRHGGWPMKGRYFGYSEPVVLDALKDMGFNALALANNHAFDLGPSGILSTLEEVDQRGFLFAGIGVDETAAATPGRRRFGSRNVSLVAIDAGPGPTHMYAENGSASRPARPGVNRLKTLRRFGIPESRFERLSELNSELQSSHLERANYAQPEDPQPITADGELDIYGTIFRKSDRWGRMVEVDQQSANQQFGAIRHAANQGDFVIAYLHHHHWEPDWQEVPPWVQTFARACVDAGASLFVSHGAPVLQALEIYRGFPIFYGLGNFLFHTDAAESEWRPREIWESLIAACHFDKLGCLSEINLLPISLARGLAATEGGTIGGLVPKVIYGHDAHRVLSQFAERSSAFGTEIDLSGATGSVRFLGVTSESIGAAS